MKLKTLFLIAFFTTLTAYSSFAFVDNPMMGNYYGHHNGWMGWMGWGFMILILILIILAIVAMVKYSFFKRDSPKSTALELLNERFAKGDLDRTEFEEKRSLISKHEM